jgi:hypothetical protein
MPKAQYPKCTAQELEVLKKYPPLSKSHEELLRNTRYDDMHGAFGGRRTRQWLALYRQLLERNRPDSLVVVDIENHARRAREMTLQNKLKAAYRHIDELTRSIEAMSSVAQAKREPLVLPKKRLRSGKIVKEAVACVAIGDVHAAKMVRASQTNGYNEWNPDICKKSFATLAENIVKMVVHAHATIPIRELHIVSVGDLTENELRTEAVATNSMSPLDELHFVTLRMESLIEYVEHKLRKAIKGLVIRVGLVWSNHDRTTPRIEWARLRETSMSYKIGLDLGRRFESLDHVTIDWPDGSQLITEPLGFPVRWHHGMSFRYQGGTGGITASAYNKIRRMNAGMRNPPILDVVGHWHHHTAPAGLWVNNCMCGYDSYAEGLGCEKSPPSQGFFLIDARHGYTLNTQLRVR